MVRDDRIIAVELFLPLHVSRHWVTTFTITLVFTDKIGEGEFVQGVMENKDILRLIQFDEPKKIQDKLKEKKH